MGEKHKLLSVGDKVTFESRGFGSGSLPDYTVRTIATVRKSPRWNRLTLVDARLLTLSTEELNTLATRLEAVESKSAG